MAELRLHEEFEQAIGASVREAVFRRDHGQCQVCGTTNDLQQHHWRHFRSLGGEDTLDNLVTVCARDHGRIHDRIIDVRVIGMHVFVRRSWM